MESRYEDSSGVDPPCASEQAMASSSSSDPIEIDPKDMVTVLASVGSYFVWSYEDVVKLRSIHRIVGGFAGTRPGQTRQNDCLSLPMILIPEEVFCLLRFRRARLVECSKFAAAPTKEDADAAAQFREQSFQEQVDAYAEVYERDEIVPRARLAVIGRKAKQRKLEEMKSLCSPAEFAKLNARTFKVRKEDCEGIEVSDAELSAAIADLRKSNKQQLERKHMLVETGTDLPEAHLREIELDYPKNEKDRLRCEVFCDLWRQGKYLTSGLKFGCDFLVYPDDILRYHSSHMAICLEDPDASIQDVDITSWVRLATQVKKTLLLCSWKDKGRTEVDYISVIWETIATRALLVMLSKFPNVQLFSADFDCDVTNFASAVCAGGVFTQLQALKLFCGASLTRDELLQFVRGNIDHLPSCVDLSQVNTDRPAHVDRGFLIDLCLALQGGRITSLALKDLVHRDAVPRLREHSASTKQDISTPQAKVGKILTWIDEGSIDDRRIRSRTAGWPAAVSDFTDFRIEAFKTSGPLKGSSFKVRISDWTEKRERLFEVYLD